MEVNESLTSLDVNTKKESEQQKEEESGAATTTVPKSALSPSLLTKLMRSKRSQSNQDMIAENELSQLKSARRKELIHASMSNISNLKNLDAKKMMANMANNKNPNADKYDGKRFNTKHLSDVIYPKSFIEMEVCPNPNIKSHHSLDRIYSLKEPDFPENYRFYLKKVMTSVATVDLCTDAFWLVLIEVHSEIYNPLKLPPNMLSVPSSIKKSKLEKDKQVLFERLAQNYTEIIMMLSSHTLFGIRVKDFVLDLFPNLLLQVLFRMFTLNFSEDVEVFNSDWRMKVMRLINQWFLGRDILLETNEQFLMVKKHWVVEKLTTLQGQSSKNATRSDFKMRRNFVGFKFMRNTRERVRKKALLNNLETKMNSIFQKDPLDELSDTFHQMDNSLKSKQPSTNTSTRRYSISSRRRRSSVISNHGKRRKSNVQQHQQMDEIKKMIDDEERIESSIAPEAHTQKRFYAKRPRRWYEYGKGGNTIVAPLPQKKSLSAAQFSTTKSPITQTYVRSLRNEQIEERVEEKRSKVRAFTAPTTRRPQRGASNVNRTFLTAPSRMPGLDLDGTSPSKNNLIPIQSKQPDNETVGISQWGNPRMQRVQTPGTSRRPRPRRFSTKNL